MATCKRCELLQEILEKQRRRYEAWYEEALDGYDEEKLVNDANWLRGLMCASSEASAAYVMVENKMLQLALNELSLSDRKLLMIPLGEGKNND